MPSDRTTAGAAGDDLTPRQSDLDEARDHLAATGEILTAIGTSASDLEGVLGTVVESARRLCRADAAVIVLLDDGAFRVTAAVGVSDDYREHMVRHPMVADRASLSGRVAVDRRAQQVADVLADPEYGRPDVQRVVRIPDPAWRADAGRRRGRRGALVVAQRGRPVQRTGHRTGHHVRRSGRDRDPQRRPRARPAEPHHRARGQGRAARGAAATSGTRSARASTSTRCSPRSSRTRCS